MSNQSVNRGFCGAIFSSYPTGFGDENKTPVNISSRAIFAESPRACENLAHPISNAPHPRNPPQKTYFDNLMPEDPPPTPKPARTPGQSSDKTPTYFCTPSHPQKSTSTPFRTPVRRFFTDPSAQSTPDCFGPVQLETPRAKRENPLEEMTICEGETSNLTVGVRVRPMSLRELNDPEAKPVVRVHENSVTVDSDSSQHSFNYDHCFKSSGKSSSLDQKRIFESMVLPLVESAFEGYNVCLFAYGQTGSGKSYSMMGSEVNQSPDSRLPEGAGIIPRFCHEIFSRARDNENLLTSVEISYFEIYNEKIHDLLASNSNGGRKRTPLRVREHPVFGPYVVDLSQHCVQSYGDLQGWLRVGSSQKATAATEMNEKSSRSHSIFSVVLTQGQKGKTARGDPSRRSKINLVDLAGSERLSQTCASGERLREGVSINKSLLTLGKVIASLAESTNNRKRGFVPYRESILTWLLKESLGGNSKTAMLATVAPSSLHLEETLATLRYACQARSIVNRVRINEDPHDKLIRELKAEVLRLRGVRENYEKQLGNRNFLGNDGMGQDQDKEREIERLRSQLKQTEEQLKFTQKSWSEKLEEAEKRKGVEINFLRRCGIAVEIDFPENIKSPCLVHLAPDPILSGTLLYLIPQGSVSIGRNTQGTRRSSVSPDILLNGPLVSPLHCTIENNEGQLTLKPQENSDTYVNGQIVRNELSLRHGDRLVIGGNHYFKVCNPGDGNGQCTSQSIDYEFAHQEILTIQEDKLRKELEESKQKAIKELENAKRDIEFQLGSQKVNYEREIKCLGSTLEHQKQALAEVTKRKRELEIEKEMLTHQIERNTRQRISPEETPRVSPYRSNFLDELEKVLTETTNDAEAALTNDTSRDSMRSGGITLHEMQLLVREAKERCREIGLNYEFLQQKVITDNGLRSMIRVRDRMRKLEAFWEPLYFLDWVQRLRDNDHETTRKDLMDSTEHWEALDESQLEDSLDSSRISINLTPIKRQLNESLLQLSMNGSLFEAPDEVNDPLVTQRRDDMKSCLLQMEIAARTLGKLCSDESEDISKEVTESLTNVNGILASLRKTLDLVDNKNSSASVKNIFMKSYLSSSSRTPTRSPRALKCPVIRENPGKTVRFNVQ
ncbi:kinesin-like protein KIF14 isoform X1 [Diachasma alloeum]|uniref:kinesin-like protein KIF14 isoform X1 n=1 Tax=Diachasma alloeum TaxID=454923 RepID=UPI00073830D8|nr:kinesin-like protein KIF14 isoform X1 [Diachasma alloeum]